MSPQRSSREPGVVTSPTHVNEHLQRPESLSIEADMRRLLEGRVEALEANVLLLESVVRVLKRDVLNDDDVLTLRATTVHLVLGP